MNIKIISIISMLFTVSSCGLFGGDERPVYQGAEYYKNLEVPPDLTEPDTGGQLRVPKASDEALQRFRDNNKLETVITPKFDGVRIVNYAGNSWLEIDNSVEFVWGRLLEFWEGEGISLVEIRPELGFMETDWVERLDANAGFFRSMFQRFEPDQKDKFRVRVERFDYDNKTRLYIAHSRIERIVRGEYADEFIWETRPSDLEAEREIISRMALFAGKNEEQTLQLLNNYRPYSSLVKIDRTNTTALTMTGSMDFVWRRAMRALDRMRMKDIREQKENNTIYFIVGDIADEDIHTEDDDLSKSSWLMNLFTDVDEKTLATNTSRHYRLEFTDVKGRIQIEVKDERDSQTSDDDGNVYGTALAEQLRNVLAEKLE
ncbi:MAG: outer membrane protein assembly factor BamC [Gammaproteobacteria bacterium]|nr:outer membrane protein assembly factor BamC [Gammaproteobacteria bacterium]